MINNKIKAIYRKLISKYQFFVRVELWRNRKRYSVRILCSPSEVKKGTIHFIHRYITNNTGDLACGYYNYFLSEFCDFECVLHDINGVNFSLIKKSDFVLIGGGGLLNASPEWNYSINRSSRLAKKSIIWSAGFNSSNGLDSLDYSKFDLFAVRDFRYKDFRFVPCATCMMPSLSKEYPILREFGVVAHKDVIGHIPTEFLNFERITNEALLDDMVRFIGSSEVVLTNSYHAVYWSTLLKRKCILFSPRSEKYSYFKYVPALYSGDLFEDVRGASVYENALNDSKELTLNYLNDIKIILNTV